MPYDIKIINDKKAMGNILRLAKSILGYNNFTALYGKGTGNRLAIADTPWINTLVAIPPIPGASHAPYPGYDVEHFTYGKNNDIYTCLQGNTLTTTGYWHEAKNNAREVSYRFRDYTTHKCKTCKVRPFCTKSVTNGKQVRRSEYAQNIENNKKRIANSGKLYKRRQAIVEHPSGVIKRQWGFNYITTKTGIERASVDFGFTMVAYNFRRFVNILEQDKLMGYWETLFDNIFAKITLITEVVTHFNEKGRFSQIFNVHYANIAYSYNNA